MEKEPTTENGEYKNIAHEIKDMHEKDQDMRERAMKNRGIIESEEDDTLDFRNTEKMKEIVGEIGWPTVSKVGKEASDMAWLLVQHADHDIEFQKECLRLMKEQAEGEVSKPNIAYLEDRILVNEGRPQLYGTQFHKIKKYDGDAEYVPRPIQDPDLVDQRREAMGMASLEEGTKSFLEKYKEYPEGDD